jgi:predicted phosphodiesterase
MTTTTFAICSDLHLDTHDVDVIDKIKKKLLMASKDVDYTIIAGDIVSDIIDRMHLVNAFLKDIPNVIYVPGNHDFWNRGIDEVYLFFELQNIQAKHILNNEELTLENGLKIFGGTMWFKEEPKMFERFGMWPDFRFIKNRKSIFSENKDFVNKLGAVKPDVIISHHMPSPLSIAPEWLYENTNCFFLNNIENIVIEKAPKLYVHGHTHNPFDYFLHETRVVCNPFGYPGELIFNWEPKVVAVIT